MLSTIPEFIYDDEDCENLMVIFLRQSLKFFSLRNSQ